MQPVPPTCCKGADQAHNCTCGDQATCSCGKKPALECACARATIENKVEGPRCSCRLRPAGQCTCERRGEENQVQGATCDCGERAADACTCEKNPAASTKDKEIETEREGEIDLTNAFKKKASA